MKCQANDCTNEATCTAMPDDGDDVQLCQRCFEDASNGLCSLSIGQQVLMWTNWEGWFFLPEKWEPKGGVA